MARYEIVVHAEVEVDCLSPELAAERVKGCMAESIDPNAEVRGLAVWSPHDGTKATPLPDPHLEQLQDFFRGMRWHADMTEAAFRAEVARILEESEAGTEATPSAG